MSLVLAISAAFAQVCHVAQRKSFDLLRHCRLPVVIALVLYLTGCQSPPALNYQTWVDQLQGQYDSSLPSDTQSFVLRSRSLEIDTIFRSMQGPYEALEVDVDASGLIWLTSYAVRLLDAGDGKRLPDGFMCHNNLNIADKSVFPWQVKTLGTKIRLFTLTEGQTSVQLPPGFGIPYPTAHAFELVSQVLNHNDPQLHTQVSHEASLRYVEAGPAALTPLYQQAVFVTKQTGGPDGEYDADPASFTPTAQSPVPSDIATCQPAYDGELINPFQDQLWANIYRPLDSGYRNSGLAYRCYLTASVNCGNANPLHCRTCASLCSIVGTTRPNLGFIVVCCPGHKP